MPRLLVLRNTQKLRHNQLSAIVREYPGMGRQSILTFLNLPGRSVPSRQAGNPRNLPVPLLSVYIDLKASERRSQPVFDLNFAPGKIISAAGGQENGQEGYPFLTISSRVYTFSLLYPASGRNPMASPEIFPKMRYCFSSGITPPHSRRCPRTKGGRVHPKQPDMGEIFPPGSVPRCQRRVLPKGFRIAIVKIKNSNRKFRAPIYKIHPESSV